MMAFSFSVERRNRIEAAGMQGMAAQHAAHGQPATLEGAEAGDRLHCVRRTGRMEATGWSQQGADEALVAAQHEDKQTIYHDTFMPKGGYFWQFARRMNYARFVYVQGGAVRLLR